MKLVVAIVQKDDAPDLLDALIRQGIRATRIDTAGGFLKAGNVTILSGVADDEIPVVQAAISNTCRTRWQLFNPLLLDEGGGFYLPEPFEVEIGGATVFVLDVERFVPL